MVLSVRQVFIVGFAAFLITKYYLEKQFEREEIFWIYSSLSVVIGLLSAYTVVIQNSLKATFIPLTAVAVALAIIYYQGDEESTPASG